MFRKEDLFHPGTAAAPLTRRTMLGLSAAGAAMAGFAAQAATPSRAPRLHRGGSIHTLMNWAELEPGSKDHHVWPPFAQAKYQTPASFLDRLRATGIDHLRLTVDQGPFLQAQGARKSELDAILLRKCRFILDRGLDVIVDFHPISQIAKYHPFKIAADIGGQLFKDYAAMIAHVAGVLKALDPARVALEPFNEPPYGYDPRTTARWQKMMEVMHAGIRARNRDIAVVWSGAKSSDIEALVQIDPKPFRDDNIFWSFHYYSPHPFTHQSLRSSQGNLRHYRYLTDIPYPAREGNAALLLDTINANLTMDRNMVGPQRRVLQRKAADFIRTYLADDFGPHTIARDFDKANAWARKNGIPSQRIFLGEFGVIRRNASGNGPINRQRLAWLRDVRKAAEARGFGWSIWDINQPEMGIVYKRDVPAFDDGMIEALGLKNPAS
ncbi:MAG: glycoside hydrolase family 5 protein [Beijerinckiaceae bacterium]